MSKSDIHTTDMLARLQSEVENEKFALARALHDDMGALLVSAVMDTAWAEQHLDSAADLSSRLARVRQSLAAAVDLKRSLIESLRPTLLDTFGLFSALRWQQKHLCENASLVCSETYPADEPKFKPEASIVIFRIIQEAMGMCVRQPSAKSAHLEVALDAEYLRVSLIGERARADSPWQEEVQNQRDVMACWLIEHRVRSLAGLMTLTHTPNGGVDLKIRFPVGAVVSIE